MSTKDDIYSLAAGNRGFVCLASFSFRAAHLFSAIRGNSPRRGIGQPLGGGNWRSPGDESLAMSWEIVCFFISGCVQQGGRVVFQVLYASRCAQNAGFSDTPR